MAFIASGKHTLPVSCAISAATLLTGLAMIQAVNPAETPKCRHRMDP